MNKSLIATNLLLLFFASAMFGFWYDVNKGCQQGTCGVLSYDIISSSASGRNRTCVKISALWAVPAEPSKFVELTPIEYMGGGCWTFDSSEKIMAVLTQYYPIGSTRTCYHYLGYSYLRPFSWYIFLTVGTVVAVMLVIALVILSVRCIRRRGYERVQ